MTTASIRRGFYEKSGPEQIQVLEDYIKKEHWRRDMARAIRHAINGVVTLKIPIPVHRRDDHLARFYYTSLADLIVFQSQDGCLYDIKWNRDYFPYLEIMWHRNWSKRFWDAALEGKTTNVVNLVTNWNKS